MCEAGQYFVDCLFNVNLCRGNSDLSHLFEKIKNLWIARFLKILLDAFYHFSPGLHEFSCFILSNSYE